MTVKFNDDIIPGDVIALGDIHATATLYDKFLAWVKDTGCTVVLLGDMIDRGGEDLNVLEKTRNLLEDSEGWGLQAFYALMGNHERMFLDYVTAPNWGMGEWLQNGANFDQMEEIKRLHTEWIRELPIYMTIGDVLFVHGGIFPGHDPQKTIDENRAESFLWMREPFLKHGPEFHKWSPNLKKVVHGHTPTLFEDGGVKRQPVVKEDRVNIDTGAYSKRDGCLTAYNVTQNTFKQFFHKP